MSPFLVSRFYHRFNKSCGWLANIQPQPAQQVFSKPSPKTLDACEHNVQTDYSGPLNH
jgi:hypothetical protein